MEYREYILRKIYIIIFVLFLIILLSIIALNTGSYKLSVFKIIKVILGLGDEKSSLIFWSIRFPRVLGAILSGMGLGLAGCVSQILLKNPMASPFTLGVSQGAAFGVTLGIVFNISFPYSSVLFALIGAIGTTCVILLISRSFMYSPEALILSGVALGSFFSAVTTILQYFSNEVKIASIVFWTFGDLGRISLKDLWVIFFTLLISCIYFMSKRWEYNSLGLGESTAKSLGVEVEKERVIGMFLSSLIAAVVTSFSGVIGFVGLVAPHVMRRLIGSDNRFLLPASTLGGALLLLFSDTIARTVISPIILPVGAITSFIGAPFLIYLLSRRFRG